MSVQTDWRVGDFAERLEDHALVRKGEVHVVTKMYRGGYLGFAGQVGGEWNPNGWRKVEKGSVAHEIEMSVVRTTLRNAIIPPATSCGTDCDCTAECERDFSPAHREAQPETDGGGNASGMSDLEWAVYTAAYSILRDYENHPLKDRGLINAGDQRIPKLIAAQVVEQMAALASKGV